MKMEAFLNRNLALYSFYTSEKFLMISLFRVRSLIRCRMIYTNFAAHNKGTLAATSAYYVILSIVILRNIVILSITINNYRKFQSWREATAWHETRVATHEKMLALRPLLRKHDTRNDKILFLAVVVQCVLLLFAGSPVRIWK